MRYSRYKALLAIDTSDFHRTNLEYGGKLIRSLSAYIVMRYAKCPLVFLCHTVVHAADSYFVEYTLASIVYCGPDSGQQNYMYNTILHFLFIYVRQGKNSLIRCP